MTRIPHAELPQLDQVMRNNLHRTLYNNAPLCEGFMTFARVVHHASSLPHRVRELAILRVASLLHAEVEWAQHFAIAQRAGVSVEEARAIRDGRLSAFSPADRAAIEFAVAVEQRTVSDDVWKLANEHYSAAQLLDLSVLVGFYSMASRVTLALEVEVDPGLTTIAAS